MKTEKDCMLLRGLSFYPNRSKAQDFDMLGHSVATGRLLTLDGKDRERHLYASGITGSGKSYFLLSLIIQLISSGMAMCVVDPTGWIYRQVVDYLTYCISDPRFASKAGLVREILSRYLFLDLDDPDNPIRLNPLEAQGVETSEELVDDFMSTINRLFGSLEEQRRLRNIIRNTLLILAELNRLSPHQRPEIPGCSYPLNLRAIVPFLMGEARWRRRVLAAIPDSTITRFAKEFFLQQFHGYTDSQRHERLESTLNILQYFLSDSLVSRFFDTQYSTLHIPELLRSGRSLFCHLPLGKNLMSCQLVGTMIADLVQRSAFRRPEGERQRQYTLILDEFQNFANEGFAQATAELRQYGVRLIAAHQTQSQPPFHTSEGQHILRTIRGNSRIKVLFQLDRLDAEELSRSVCAMTQQRCLFEYEERSIALGESEVKTTTVSFAESTTESETNGTTESRSLAESDGYSISRSRGTTIGRTLTQGFGRSFAEGMGRSISRSEMKGVTEVRSEEFGIAVSLGDSWSQVRDRTTGTTVTKTETEGVAVTKGWTKGRSKSSTKGSTETWGESESETNSYQSGRSRTRERSFSDTQGHQTSETLSGSDSYTVSDEHGNTLVKTESQAGMFFPGAPSRKESRAEGTRDGWSESRQEMSGHSTGQTDMESHTKSRSDSRSDSYSSGKAWAETSNYSQAISRLKATARSFSRSRGETKSQSSSRAVGHTESEGHRQGVGGSRSRSRTKSHGRSKGFSRQEGRSTTVNRTQTLTQNEKQDLSEAFSVLAQVSRAFSKTLQHTVSRSESISVSRQTGQSRTESTAEAAGRSHTETRQMRKHFLSLEGEREISINQLQTLPVGHCVVSKQNLASEVIETLPIPERFLTEAHDQSARRILSQQRERLGMAGDDETHREESASSSVVGRLQDKLLVKKQDDPFGV